MTQDTERIYYITHGKGKFKIEENIVDVEDGDVVTIPAHTKYNYRPTTKETLKVLLFMELRDN
jgi:mannose-6-phosphate isomerase-like protein (cupin superfamily)